MDMTRRTLVVAALAAVLVPALPCLGQVTLCVDVHADEGERESLRRLVNEEVAHHPTHKVVESGCAARLAVELLTVGGRRHLTARVNEEIPVRYEADDAKDVSRRLTDAIALVLHNDPVYLSESLDHQTAFQRFGESIKRGHNLWRVEVFQSLANGDGNLAQAPGLAVAMTRGSGHWQVGARVYGGGWPAAGMLGRRDLRAMMGFDAGLTWEASEKGAATFYSSAGAGLQYLRFEGLLESGGQRFKDHVDQVGLALWLRAGVRVFRWHDYDLDVWAAGYLPCFKTNDPDSELFGGKGAYTPMAQMGIGVGF
jgi:hypothetical protein